MLDRDIPQIEQMRMGVQYRFPVKLRGFTIHLRPLSTDEAGKVFCAVQDRLEQLPKESHRTQAMQQFFFSRETLQRASTSDPDKNDPQLTDLILGRFTTEELAYLLKEYNAGCDGCNPMLENMTEQDIKKLVDEVKKNLDGVAPLKDLQSRLIELSFLELVNLSMALLQATNATTEPTAK